MIGHTVLECTPNRVFYLLNLPSIRSSVEVSLHSQEVFTATDERPRKRGTLSTVPSTTRTATVIFRTLQGRVGQSSWGVQANDWI